VRAAVFFGPEQGLTVSNDVEIEPPREEEVLVRLAYSGVCHSDYRVVRGEWDSALPIVLGHEGAGIVERVGRRVRDVSVGDHVILVWTANCRRCFWCTSGRPNLCEIVPTTSYLGVLHDGTTRLRLGSIPVYSYSGVGSFADYAVVPETGAVRIRPDMPLDKAALIGCAVATGVGACINTARVEAGTTALVVGCGGVGLAIVQGCKLSGAGRIIAADIVERKLAIARQLGATDVINARGVDLAEAARELTGGRGVDYAFEAIGNKATIEQIIDAIRPGGTAVVVGEAATGVRVELDPFLLADRERVVMGSSYGSIRPSIDFPRLVDLYMRGQLQLDGLVSRVRPLEEVQEAFDDMGIIAVERTVLRLGAG